MKKTIIVRLLLIGTGVVLLLNVGGLIIDLLYSLGLFISENVKLQGLSVVSSFLSLAFIISLAIFWFRLYKLNRDSVLWWNILCIVGFLIVIYKIFRPTYLVDLIPYYFIISFGGLGVLWFVIFKYLRNLLGKSDVFI
jgi:hypothetical protein